MKKIISVIILIFIFPLVMGSVTFLDKFTGDSLNNVNYVVTDGNYAYTSQSGTNHINIFNVTKKSDISYLVNFSNSTAFLSPADINLDNDRLYICSNNDNIVSYDLSDKTNPIILSQYTNTTTLDNCEGLFLRGDYLYGLSHFTGWLSIVNKTNSSSLTQVSALQNITTFKSAYDLFVDSSDYVYIVSGEELEVSSYAGISIINATNKTRPTQAGFYNLTSNNGCATPNRVVVDNNILYVTCFYENLTLIMNVTDKLNINYITNITTIYAWDIELENDLLYILTDYQGLDTQQLKIYNISNPLSPTLKENYPINATTDWSYKIDVLDSYVYVVDSILNGLFVFDALGNRLAVTNKVIKRESMGITDSVSANMPIPALRQQVCRTDNGMLFTTLRNLSTTDYFLILNSSDNGTTWDEYRTTEGGSGITRQVIDCKGNNVIVSFLSGDATNIRVVSTNDYGQNWNYTSVSLHGTYADRIIDVQLMPNNIAYILAQNSSTNALVYRSTNAGDSFSSPTSVPIIDASLSYSSEDVNRLVIMGEGDSNDKLFIISVNSTPDIALYTSTDAGATFSSATEIYSSANLSNGDSFWCETNNTDIWCFGTKFVTTPTTTHQKCAYHYDGSSWEAEDCDSSQLCSRGMLDASISIDLNTDTPLYITACDNQTHEQLQIYRWNSSWSNPMNLTYWSIKNDVFYMPHAYRYIENGYIDLVTSDRDSLNMTYLLVNVSSLLPEQSTPPANNPPVITLILPENENISSINITSFTANYSDSEGTAGNCELFINSTAYGINASVTNNTQFSIDNNVSLAEGHYTWWLNCTDGTNTTKSSERNITIDLPEPPYLQNTIFPLNNSVVEGAKKFTWNGTCTAYDVYLNGTKDYLLASDITTNYTWIDSTDYTDDETNYTFTVKCNDSSLNTAVNITMKWACFQFGCDVHHSFYQNKTFNYLGMDESWSFSFPATNQQTYECYFTDDIISCPTYGGTTYLINATSGTQICNYTNGNPHWGHAEQCGDYVFIHDRTLGLLAIDKSCNLVKTFGFKADMPVVCEDGIGYVCDGTMSGTDYGNNVMAYWLDNLTVKWNSTSGTGYSSSRCSGLAIDDDELLWGQYSGKIFTMNKSDGLQIKNTTVNITDTERSFNILDGSNHYLMETQGYRAWAYNIDDNFDYINYLQPLSDDVNTICANKGDGYCLSGWDTGRFRKWNPQTNSIGWQKDLSGAYFSAYIANNIVFTSYYAGGTTTLVLYDYATGTQLDSNSQSGSSYGTTPKLYGDSLYVASALELVKLGGVLCYDNDEDGAYNDSATVSLCGGASAPFVDCDDYNASIFPPVENTVITSNSVICSGNYVLSFMGSNDELWNISTSNIDVKFNHTNVRASTLGTMFTINGVSNVTLHGINSSLFATQYNIKNSKNVTIKDGVTKVSPNEEAFRLEDVSGIDIHNYSITAYTNRGYEVLEVRGDFNDSIFYDNYINEFYYLMLADGLINNVTIYNNQITDLYYQYTPMYAWLPTIIEGAGVSFNGLYFNTTYTCEGTNIIGGNCSGGNYWDVYEGADIDGDGIGDIPSNYSPNSGNFYFYDYLPLTNNQEYCADIDGDGFNASYGGASCGISDCNDNNASVLPPYYHMNITSDIVLCNGTYTADLVNNEDYFVVIDRDDVKLKCNNTILAGEDVPYTGNGIYSEGRNNITIKGCTLANFTKAIATYWSTNTSVYNNTILSYKSQAIKCNYGCTNWNVTGNDITGQWNTSAWASIDVWSSNDVLIKGNYIHDITHTGFAGIIVQFQNDSIIRDNRLINTSLCNIICDYSRCQIINNTINSSDNETACGINVDHGNGDTSNTIVANNTVERNGTVCIWAFNGGDNISIYGNTCYLQREQAGQQSSIWLINSSVLQITGAKVYNNTLYGGSSLFDMRGVEDSVIYNNRWINFDGHAVHTEHNSCDNVTFYNNIFNTTQSYGGDNVQGNIYFNTTKTLGTNIIGGAYIGGNYWSNYLFSDADGDGIGDNAYKVDSTHYDYLPLTNDNCFALDGEKTFALSGTYNICNATYVVNDTGSQGVVRISGSNITVLCNDTKLMGDTYSRSKAGFIVSGDNVTIDGCNISGYGYNINVYGGSDYATIKNNYIYNYMWEGISSSQNIGLNISNNYITRPYNQSSNIGINAYGTRNSNFNNNILYNNSLDSLTISINSAEYVTVRNNTINKTHNGGMIIEMVNNTIVRGNTIYDLDEGHHTGFTFNCEGKVCHNQTFRDNYMETLTEGDLEFHINGDRNGFYFINNTIISRDETSLNLGGSASTDFIIANNTIDGNGTRYGIQFDVVSGLLMYGNSIVNYSNAIFSNNISNALIYNNVFNITTSTTFNNNLGLNVSLNTTKDCTGTNIIGGDCIGGNYYSAYVGAIDANNDGISEFSYEAKTGYTDYLPLTNNNETSLVVYLVYPNDITTRLQTINFTYYFDSNVNLNSNCTLNINGTAYNTSIDVADETNHTVQNNATLGEGFYLWNVTCTDGANTNTSETWNFTIDNCADVDGDGFNFSYLAGACGLQEEDCDDTNSSVLPPPLNPNDFGTAPTTDQLYCSGTYQRNRTNIVFPNGAGITLTCNRTHIVGNRSNTGIIHFTPPNTGGTVKGCTFSNITHPVIANANDTTFLNNTFYSGVNTANSDKVRTRIINNTFMNINRSVVSFETPNSTLYEGNNFNNIVGDNFWIYNNHPYKDVTFRNNIFNNSYNGIALLNVQNFTFENNIITNNNEDGVDLYIGNSRVVFSGNHIYNSNGDIRFLNNSDVTFTDNIKENTTEEALFEDGTFVITGNIFRDIMGANGLIIETSNNAIVSGNTFDNVIGEDILVFENVNDSTISNNTVKNSLYGIYLGSSNNNTITGNNITNSSSVTEGNYYTDNSYLNVSGRICDIPLFGGGLSFYIYSMDREFQDIITEDEFKLNTDEGYFDPTHDYGVLCADLSGVDFSDNATVWFDYDVFGWDTCAEFSAEFGGVPCFFLDNQTLTSNGEENNHTFNSPFNSTVNISRTATYPPRIDYVEETETLYGLTLKNSNDNLIYNNYFDNDYNAYDNGTNDWNTTKAETTNILGNPYIGGNYWADYTGNDTTGDYIGEMNYTGTTFVDYLPLTIETSYTAPTNETIDLLGGGSGGYFNYQCSDGIDNDHDGYIDYPDDIGCEDEDDNDEKNGVTTKLIIENKTIGQISQEHTVEYDGRYTIILKKDSYAYAKGDIIKGKILTYELNVSKDGNIDWIRLMKGSTLVMEDINWKKEGTGVYAFEINTSDLKDDVYTIISKVDMPLKTFIVKEDFKITMSPTADNEKYTAKGTLTKNMLLIFIFLGLILFVVGSTISYIMILLVGKK